MSYTVSARDNKLILRDGSEELEIDGGELTLEALVNRILTTPQPGLDVDREMAQDLTFPPDNIPIYLIPQTIRNLKMEVFLRLAKLEGGK